MRKHHPDNERVKRQYFVFLKEAKRQSEASVDEAAKAISRFEEYTKYRDFKRFHFEQAVAFKGYLAAQRNEQTGAALSKATLNSTLKALKAFFQWLAMQPGYKSRVSYTDVEYFNLSEKEARIASAKRPKPVPSLEQITKVIKAMPSETELERRDRAVLAFTLLTGARDSATASLKLKHVDLNQRCVFQDAREVETKASKTFTTYFFPVGEEVERIVHDWVTYLREDRLFGLDDPVFPKTAVGRSERQVFEPLGLTRDHWSNATPIRKIFKDAFKRAELSYFNPHSFRKTLAQVGYDLCSGAEEFKAWSQNLGHEGVLTTFVSYGEVQPTRQSEIIRELEHPRPARSDENVNELAKAVAREIRSLD